MRVELIRVASHAYANAGKKAQESNWFFRDPEGNLYLEKGKICMLWEIAKEFDIMISTNKDGERFLLIDELGGRMMQR